ncbi:MAG: hypothetical protein WAM39_01485, partial [Bryobacteraceae bacterium]
NCQSTLKAHGEIVAGALRHKVLLTPQYRAVAVLMCIAISAFGVCWARPIPPQPPGPDANGTARRLADINQRVKETKSVDTTAERALDYSRFYIGKAQQALQGRQIFEADRMIGAADALDHIAEHQEHMRMGPGPKGPPPPGEISKHLERVYFRTQQAEYFLEQSRDKEAASFPRWARDFYQLAVRAYEHQDVLAADENAKCAEEVVKALENLAQAASPRPPSPPGPPPR